jgi:hypothetical protein
MQSRHLLPLFRADAKNQRIRENTPDFPFPFPPRSLLYEKNGDVNRLLILFSFPWRLFDCNNACILDTIITIYRRQEQEAKTNTPANITPARSKVLMSKICNFSFLPCPARG